MVAALLRPGILQGNLIARFRSDTGRAGCRGRYFTDSYWKQDAAPHNVSGSGIRREGAGELPLNVSIDQFGISPKGETGSSYGAVAVLSTNAKESMSAEVNLYGDEQLLTSKMLELEPGKN